MKKIQINETELRKSVRKHLLEQSESGAKDNREEKQRCVSGNIMPLDELVGPSDNFSNYASGVLKRDGGINGMVDTLDMLRTLRLHSNIKDNLIACLKFLGQDYEVIEKENTLTNFWATAIQLWDISVVPKIKTIEI